MRTLCASLTSLALMAGLAIPYAHANQFDPPSMIDVGGGAAFLGGNNPLAALFKVEAVGASPMGANSYFIIARVNGQAALGADGVSYLDVQFNSLGFQNGSSNDNFWGMTFVNLGIQRNLALNNALTLRVSLVGIQGAYATNVSDNVRFVLKGALDLLGLGYTQRAADGADLTGMGTGASGEMGFEFNKRFRVALGEKLEIVNGRPIQVQNGEDCSTYTDTWGNSYTHCAPHYDTHYLDNRLNSNTYLTLTYDLTQNLHIFGQASYNVYSVEDSTGSVPPSTNGGFQFFLGVGGNI